MARAKDFYCYRNIYTIDTGYSFNNGAGYAIFDNESFKLKACGIVRLFAPGMESFAALDEITNKIRKVWEDEVGFSYDPTLLCIEFPKIYYSKHINQDSLLMLACLSGMIRKDYKIPTGRVIFTRPNQWKGNKQKDETIADVHKNLDAWSKKVLQLSLNTIPASLHHNVYDAIGLGLWAIENYKKIIN